MSKAKCLALIAHDNLKPAMIEWARVHRKRLSRFRLIATGTTGGLLRKELGFKVRLFKSGPLGGDQQIGAQIAEKKVSAVVFFMDPLSPHPHDVDVKALLRIATLYNVPMACNRATADILIRSS